MHWMCYGVGGGVGLLPCPVADQIWIEFWMIDDRLETLDNFFEVVDIPTVII